MCIICNILCFAIAVSIFNFDSETCNTPPKGLWKGRAGKKCQDLGQCTLTLSDPGYFRLLTIRGGGGGALKAPLYDLKNYCVNLHHIIHVNFTRCFRHDPIGIFRKFAILTILQRFQNKKERK